MLDPVNRFILFTNAKCGGTTLKHWFLSSASFHRYMRSPKSVHRHFRLKALELDYWKARHSLSQYLKCQNDHGARRFFRHYRRMVGDLDFSQFPSKKFMVVRDPHSRAVSAFIDKFCGEDRDKDWVRHVVRSCGVESPSFLDFLGYVHRTPAGQMDAHWRRQTHAIEGVSDVTLMKLETLESDLEKHSQVWGDRNKAILARRCQSNTYSLELTEKDAASLTADTLIALKKRHGVFPTKRSFLTPQAKSLVQMAYRRDFDRFGYALI